MYTFKKEIRKVNSMAKVSLLNLYDDLVRPSDVLTAGIEKGMLIRFSLYRFQIFVYINTFSNI